MPTLSLSTRARRGFVAAAVLAATTAGVGSSVFASAEPADASTVRIPAGGSQVVCSSENPELASRLSKDIAGSLHGNGDSTAFAVSERSTGTTCSYRPDATFDSASVVKVTVLGALLRQAQEENRGLTQHEKTLAHDMITKSDNASTSALWREIGPDGIRHFLDLAGMQHTEPGPGGSWGLTRIIAGDELKLLHLLHSDNQVLDRGSRTYALKLMAHVEPDQRWGASAGAPTDGAVHIKNGWLPRDTHGWRVHSIGTFTGQDGTYDIVALSHDNRTMQDGINTLERTTHLVNRDLASSTAP